MPKRDGDDYIISESGNWNVADDYSKQMVMKCLVLASKYEDIAYFGFEGFMEELGNYNMPPNDIIRYKALDRLIKELIKLVNQTKFALKRDQTKKVALKYKDELKKIHESLPKLIKIIVDKVNKTKAFRIKSYALFNEVLDIVAEIRSKLNEPLNKNHLIFTDKEEFDPKKFKDNMKRRMIEEG